MAYFDSLRLKNLFDAPPVPLTGNEGIGGIAPSTGQSFGVGLPGVPDYDFQQLALRQARQQSMMPPGQTQEPDTSQMPTFLGGGMTDYERASLSSLDNYRRGQLAQGGERIDLSAQKNLNANEIAKQRADIYEFKAKHPNMQIFTPKGGTAYAIDPITGKKIDLGIDTGTLSDSDRADLEFKNEKELIKERGNEARLTETARKPEEIEKAWGAPIQAFGRDNKPLGYMLQINSRTGETRKVPLGSNEITRTDNTADSATQERAGLVNKAMQVINQHPEWKKYITIDTNGVTIKPVGTGILYNDLSKEKRDEIYSSIYGTSAPTIANETKITDTDKDLRQKAIDQLTTDKQKTTEANIKYVMDQLKKK